MKTEDLTKWFQKSEHNLAKLVGKKTAKRLLFYSICDRVREMCEPSKYFWKDTYEMDLRALVCDLLRTLDARFHFKMSEWNGFYQQGEQYSSFMRKYRINPSFPFCKMGTKWQGLFNGLYGNRDTKSTMYILKKLQPILWLQPFVDIFCYQSSLSNGFFVFHSEMTFAQMPYWELKEYDEYIASLGKIPVQKVIKRVTFRLSDTGMEDLFLDREALFFKMIKGGMSVPRAMELTRFIRKGMWRKIPEQIDGKELKKHGFTDLDVDALKSVHYITTRRYAIFVLLSTRKIV